MALDQIIKLFINHIILIICSGILLAFVVYFATRNQPAVYSSNTTIYTGFATGYTIESGIYDRTDYYGSKSKFDNLVNYIKSRETCIEVGISLLSRHLYENSIRKKKYNHLNSILNQETIKQIVDNISESKTKKNLISVYNSNTQNAVYKIINSTHDFYGIYKINKIDIKRIGSSDLVKLAYECRHPSICKETLETLISTFLIKFQWIYESQADSVVNYYQYKIKQAQIKLNNVEEDLLRFKKENDIINYNEQSGVVANKKDFLNSLLQQEVMNLSAYKSALKTIEGQLSLNTSGALCSNNILNSKKQISKFTSKLIKLSTQHPSKKDSIYKLNNILDSLKSVLKLQIEDLYKFERSIDGLPRKPILDNWYQKTIQYEESNAKVESIKTSIEEFNSLYKNFATIGAQLKKIERKIKIAEEEYIRTLNSFNIAKLKQQNARMSSSIKVIDKPFIPTNAKTSKRKLLVIMSFLVGSFFIFIIILLFDLFDKSIKTPERAEKFSEMKNITVFPRRKKNLFNLLNIEYINKRNAELIFQKIIATQNCENTHHIITIFSIHKNEGKSYIGNILAESIHEKGHSCLFCKPQKKQNNIVFNAEYELNYQLDNSFSNKADISSLLSAPKDVYQNVKYIIIELPDILDNGLPEKIINKSTVNLLICNSKRNWYKADENILSIYKANMNNIFLILNNCLNEEIKKHIGFIPIRKMNYRTLLSWLMFQKGNSSS